MGRRIVPIISAAFDPEQTMGVRCEMSCLAGPR
jgi:hypothetical protein